MGTACRAIAPARFRATRSSRSSRSRPVDPIALHDKADQGICHQLGERALCDADVYDMSLTRGRGFTKSGHMRPPTFPLSQRLRNGIPHNRMVA